MKLLIKFITPNLCKVISSRVKKHCRNQAFRTVYRQRLARADFFIKLQQALLIIRRHILAEACNNLWLLAKQIYNFLVRPYTKRTNEYSNRDLPCPVYTNIKNVIGVCFIFQPCATVWNYGTGV